MSTLVYPADFFTRPPKNAVEGLQTDSRKYEVTAAQTGLTTVYIALGILPAGCKLVNAQLESDDLDTNAANTVDLGILNTYFNAPDNAIAASVAHPATYNSGGVADAGTAPALVAGQNIFTAATIARTGGVVTLGSQAAAGGTATLVPSDAIGVDYAHDRIIAAFFSAASTGTQAGTLQAHITYEAA